MQEINYFAQMIEQECNSRTCERAKQCVQQIKEAGVLDEDIFQKFWEAYQELLVQKLGYESYYLADMLEKKGTEIML